MAEATWTITYDENSKEYVFGGIVTHGVRSGYPTYSSREYARGYTIAAVELRGIAEMQAEYHRLNPKLIKTGTLTFGE